MAKILTNIVETRKRHLDDIRARVAHVAFDTLRNSERSLYDSLARPGTAFIMECKSASPSLGPIRDDYKPGEIASVYSRYAAGISVLCEPDYFNGDYDHLATVAATTHLPVLCKDFIIDEVQIYAARYFGADAILLMLSVLSDEEYAHLASVAESLHMDVLTEVINEDEAHRAIKLGAKIFGVNHRNLHDLSIDLDRSARLAELAPDGAVVVSESGIRDTATVRRLGGHSDAFLVGSQLTSSRTLTAPAANSSTVRTRSAVCAPPPLPKPPKRAVLSTAGSFSTTPPRAMFHVKQPPISSPPSPGWTTSPSPAAPRVTTSSPNPASPLSRSTRRTRARWRRNWRSSNPCAKRSTSRSGVPSP